MRRSVTIVTGGSRGIGAATCARLAADGHDLVIGYRHTIGSPGEYVHYAGAKAAVEAITLGLAKELATDGIRVNAVAPGIVWTDIHRDMGDPERPAKAASRIPLGRAGAPEEIAAAVAWLLSPDASYTTGAVLRVAGGL